MQSERKKEEPRPTPEEVKNAIVTLLRAGHGVDMACDLSCYRDADDFYVVSYIGKEPMKGMGASDRKRLAHDGEWDEYCETPEEAAELFLTLKLERYGED